MIPREVTLSIRCCRLVSLTFPARILSFICVQDCRIKQAMEFYPVVVDDSDSAALSALTGGCDAENQPRRAFASVTIAFVVIGLVGNALIASIIIILKEYRKSVANWYILQLALADALFLLTLPFTAASELSGRWEFGLAFCKIKEAVLFVNYYASIYFLVVMSFDRYLAVTRAFASSGFINSLRSLTAAFIISAVGWAFSIVISTPLFMYSDVNQCKKCAYQFPQSNKGPDIPQIPFGNSNLTAGNIGLFTGNLTDEHLSSIFNHYLEKVPKICHIPEESFSIWLYLNFVIAFCVPLVLICSFYGLILMAIMGTRSVGNVDTQRSYRRRVTMIVLSLVALFVISWLPWYVVNLAKLKGIEVSRKVCENLTIAIRLLAYLNSALNPFFYSFLGARFGERLARASSRIRNITQGSQTRIGSRDHRRRRTNNSTSNSARNQRQPHVVPLADPSVAGNGNVYSTIGGDMVQMSVANKTERTIL